MDVSGFAIVEILSQMISDPDQNFYNHVTYRKLNPDLSMSSENGQWHLLAFFSQNMISAKTCYKTYNQELLTIDKAFKT